MKKKHEGQFKKGSIPWNKGKKGLQVAWNKGISYHAQGEHALWQGDKVGYLALHQWVRRYLGKPTTCSKDSSHKAKRYVWANISGEYKRDLSDYHSLCNSCNLTDGIKTTAFKNRRQRIYA